MEELKTVKEMVYKKSLDGLRETHDRIRRPGSFDETLAVTPMLQKAGIDVAIMATVSRWNYKEIPALVDVVVEHHADIFAFARYCPDADSKDSCCSP
jgi:MoaA/NifB/PqqE/SkfB family radical SAM enzyme